MSTETTDLSDSSTEIWLAFPFDEKLPKEEIESRLQALRDDPVLKLLARTSLARALKRYRAEYLASGGRLYSAEEIRREVREQPRSRRTQSSL